MPARTAVFKQGDPADSVFIINSGKVRVFRRDKTGVETELSVLGPGESFGEVALLTDEPRSANIETIEETHLTVVPRDQFNLILKDYPELSLTFVKQMSKWLLRDELRLEKEVRRHIQAPHLSWLDFIMIIGLSVLFALLFNKANPNGIPLIHTFQPVEGVSGVLLSSAKEKYKEGKSLFVDAMPANFFDQEHIKGAINIPVALFDIMYMMELSDIDREKEIIVYGRTISRRYDEEVAGKLALRGHKNISILEGDISSWKRKGYPVEP